MPLTRRAVCLVTGAVIAAPLARAQQPVRSFRIAMLFSGTMDSVERQRNRALAQLAKHGFVERRNLSVALRAGGNDRGEDSAMVQSMLAERPDAMLVGTQKLAELVHGATRSVPVVFCHVDDPVSAGLVASLARPGGFVTGISNMRADTTVKQIELLRDLLPSARRVGLLSDIRDPAYLSAKNRIFGAALRMGLDLIELDGVPHAIGGGASLQKAASMQIDAILSWILYSVHGNDAAQTIIRFGAKHRIATVFSDRDSVEQGGLIFYGVDHWNDIDRAADQLARILKGARPSDMPVERATRFELVVNLKTAKALDIKVPSAILARADRIIE